MPVARLRSQATSTANHHGALPAPGGVVYSRNTPPELDDFLLPPHEENSGGCCNDDGVDTEDSVIYIDPIGVASSKYASAHEFGHCLLAPDGGAWIRFLWVMDVEYGMSPVEFADVYEEAHPPSDTSWESNDSGWTPGYYAGNPSWELEDAALDLSYSDWTSVADTYGVRR